ncbi:hypothetical protein D3C75_964080 [compost metagenome]
MRPSAPVPIPNHRKEPILRDSRQSADKFPCLAPAGTWCGLYAAHGDHTLLSQWQTSPGPASIPDQQNKACPANLRPHTPDADHPNFRKSATIPAPQTFSHRAHVRAPIGPDVLRSCISYGNTTISDVLQQIPFPNLLLCTKKSRTPINHGVRDVLRPFF